MMFGVELGTVDYGSIPTTAIGRGLEPLDARTDLPNQIKLVVKKKKYFTFDLSN
jgi:hypothetical protein